MQSQKQIAHLLHILFSDKGKKIIEAEDSTKSI